MVRPTHSTGIHDYLERQRWFAGKGRDFTVESIHPLSWLSSPGAWPAVRVEFVTVSYPGGAATEVYQLPLAYREGPAEHLSHAYVSEWEVPELGRSAWAYDALHDKEATAYWLAGLLDGRVEPDLAFHPVGEPEVDRHEQSLVLTGEQSNTSLVYGQAALLKVFRRVQHGRNPDIVVHEAFARNNCGNVARLLGWIEAGWPAPGEGGDQAGEPPVLRGDLGMFSEFFRTATDGWELAITSVRDLYAEADLHADEVGGDFAGEAHRLGATTAEVHNDLARLLPTATWGSRELSALAAAMRGRLADAVEEVPLLAKFADGLGAAYDDLARVDSPVPVQRIHGDLHLGQTMRTVAGWRLIDFEGEPAKTLAERASVDSTIRDIAGMLRSFDYAAQHLLAEGDHLDEHQLVYRADEWSQRNRDAFCEGYGEVAGTDPRAQDVLLRAYETDKAVYEVVYEFRTRPDWIVVPLAAVERLAEPRSG